MIERLIICEQEFGVSRCETREERRGKHLKEKQRKKEGEREEKEKRKHII